MMAFIRFKGTTNPSQLGLRFGALFASFHSNSDHHHRSMLQKVRNLDDAHNLFDEMTQRRPLPSVVMFTQLLHLVTKMKHFSESLLLFKQMCAIGVPVDEYSMSIAIRCCCQLHHTNDGFAVLGCCFRKAIIPNVIIYSTLLNGLILEDRIVETERLFKKLIKQNLCEPDVAMYNTMIKGLCKFGNNVTSVALLRLMEQTNCKPDIFTYNTIIDSLCMINGLCILGRWDEVYKMLKEMDDGRISPDVQTYSVLVNAYCKEGKVEEAEAVINIMVERGTVPDIVTYNSLIDGYCLRGEMIKAREVFYTMTLRGLDPDVFTYTSLLNGYCKKSNIEEAMHLFDEITRKGLKPDVVTYSTMIQGLLRVGRCGAARKLFDEMHAQGQVPDELTYRIILNGYCKKSNIEEAMHVFDSFHSNSDHHHRSMLQKVRNLDDAHNLFDEMTQRRPLPSAVKFNRLLDLVTKMKHFSESLHLFKQMCAIGVPVNKYSMSIAIRCCCQLHHTNDGFAVLGCCFRRAIIPNVFVFSALLNGLVLEDRIVEAERLFKKLIKQNLCEPNVVMYNTMIKGLCKFGNNVTSVALLRLMEQTNCKPDIFTYNSIIDSLCKDKMIDDAFKLFKEMVFLKGILPDVITYTCMINGLCIVGRWDEVYKMLKEMDDRKKISPDVQTYTVMISGFCKEGLLKEAKQLFHKMDESGIPRNNVTYCVLLQGYLKKQHYDEVEMLMQEMDGRGYSLDATTVSLLIDGIAAGSLDRSMVKLIGKLVPKGN